MRVFIFLKVLIVVVTVFSVVSMAGATTLSADLTVDDQFEFYLSTDDSINGTLIGTGTDWRTTYSFSFSLVPNVTNYLHIVGRGKQVDLIVASFIGDFTLSDTDFSFLNGGQYLLTDILHWLVYSGPYGSGPPDVMTWQGTNASGYWGAWGARPNIDIDALWIWTNHGETGNERFFSTAIIPNNRVINNPIPEPSTMVLLGSGLTIAAVFARRLRQPKKCDG